MIESDSISLEPKWRALLRLMRFDKPIGALLLLAPTLWALMIAAEGLPSAELIVIFVLGSIVMRAAGCTANDLADRKLDGHVDRTRGRPLVTGAVEAKEAAGLLFGLLLVALALVLLTNPLTIGLSVIGAALAIIYPLMKRVTHWPQLVLGFAFSWGIPMAFSAVRNELPVGMWWLFVANVLWTIVYDTQYAMVDREDDLQIGIKSTAILFGDSDRWIIALFQIGSLGAFIICGRSFALGWPYYVAVTGVAIMFMWHQWLIRHRDEKACFAAFNQSKWIGLMIFIGIAGHYGGSVSPLLGAP